MKIKQLGLLSVLIGLFAVVSYADDRVPATPADIQRFFNTTTYVVVDRQQMTDWNFKIPAAVKKSWTITPYKVIDDREFEKLRHDTDKSFLVRLKERFPGDRIKAPYVFMNVVLGSPAENVTDMPEIAAFPLGYAEADQDSWGYKLEGFLRFMQKHILLLKEKPEIIKHNPLQYYNKDMGAIRKVGKEFWVVKRDLDQKVNTLDKIKKYYQGVVRIVEPEDIEKAIEDKRDDVVYLHKVGPEHADRKARIYKAILGAGDDKLYYFDYHNFTRKKGDGFLYKDFKRINKR